MKLCDYVKKRGEESARQAASMQALQSENQQLREQAEDQEALKVQLEDAETATKILLGEEK